MKDVLQYLIGPGLVALMTGLFVWLGRRADARASKEINDEQQRLDERKVDREEFDSITRELREALARVKADLEEERARADAAERRAGEAEQRASAAEKRAREAEKAASAATRRLGERVALLEDVLRANGIEVPGK